MPPPLSVGLNLVWLAEHAGGAGRYARRLIPALLAAEPGLRLHAYTSRAEPPDLRAEPWAGELAWTQLPVGLGSPPWHVPAQLALLPLLARRDRVDVLHGLANVAPTGPLAPPSAVTVLDLIWLRLPDQVEMPARLRKLWLWQTRRAAHGADRVLAISEATAADVRDVLGVPAERVAVTPLAADDAGDGARPVEPEASLRAALELGDAPVLLSVAQKLPYKNHAALIRALPAVPDAVLVLPGAPTPYEGELRALAERTGVAGRVFFPGWIDDARLEGLYALARGVVLPSFMEGFGLPVLEAMRRGAPVACSGTSALGEVAGDAALTFDPAVDAQIAEAMRRLVADDALRADLARRGATRAAAFTWDRTAQATLEGYRAAIDARRA